MLSLTAQMSMQLKMKSLYIKKIHYNKFIITNCNNFKIIES